MKSPIGKAVFSALTAVAVLVAFVLWRQPATPTGAPDRPMFTAGEADPGAVVGGRLIATYRSEPTNYNRLVGDLTPDELVRLLTQDTLVRVDRTTGALEPRLATEWTHSDDGLTWTLQLREDARFSDGLPFTAADVVFTFTAVFDPELASGLASRLRVDGKPLDVRARDDHTVVVVFPAPHGPGLEILDGVPMLPRHKLEAAFEAGALREAWAAGTEVSDVVGLGPFVLAEHRAGERVVFTRNVHFWRSDAQGRRLPYLDAIELQIIPELNAELLQLESGAVDLISDRVRAEDIPALRRRADRGELQIIDAGVSPSVNGLWFNLAGEAAAARPWLESEPFRRGVSAAVDREAIVDTVYLGLAEPIFGPITPGFGDWFTGDVPPTPYDPVRARELFREAGLADVDGDGMFQDADGRPARFSILTQQGNDERTRAASLIQADLRAAGIDVGIQFVDVPTLISLYGRGDYDAIYFGVDATAADPAGQAEFWLSSGQMHFWWPGQPSPATDWEARIDELFLAQTTTIDRDERVRLFGEAQRILAEHLPIIYFAAPKVTIAMSARVGGAQPSVFTPPVLWNAERLYVTDGAPGAPGR